MSEISQSLNEANQKRQSMVRIIKLVFLGLASVGLITLTWWLMHSAIYGHKPLASWFWVVGSAVLWCSFVSYFVLVNPHRWVFALVNIWGLATYLMIMPKDLYVALGGILFFLLGILFQRRMVTEEKNQLHFSMRRAISSSIIVATYGFLSVIAFNVYYFVNQDFKNNPDKFYDRIGIVASRSIPFISQNFKVINLNQSLDQYLEERAEASFPDELKQAPPSVKNLYVSQYNEQFRQQFGIEEDVTLATAMTTIINQKGRQLLEPYQKFLPLLFALIVFGLLRTFAFIFNWLAIFVSWMLFRILYMLNFFKLSKTVVEVDKLDI